MSDTLLIDLQHDIAERLRSDEVLGGIAVVTEREGDTLASIQRALGLVTARAGNRGLCLVVLQLTATAPNPDAPGPMMEMGIGVRVLENPVLNNVPGYCALSIARRVTRLLHHYTPVGLSSCLTPGNPIIGPVADPIAQVAYDVQFIAREDGYLTAPRVATPSIASTSPSVPATITLTCATPDAAIYYTTDGSYPRLEGPTSARYSEPFTLSQAATVRSAAYAAGLLPSSTPSLTIDPS